MLIAGLILLTLGLFWSALKGYVVWCSTRDLFRGGGAPTLDFPIICPIPLAVGGNWVLSALDRRPFSGFGWVAYISLVAMFGFLLWLFDRLGEPERQRQSQAIRQKHASTDGAIA